MAFDRNNYTIRKNAGRIDALTGARYVAIMLIVFSHFEFLGKDEILGEIYWKYFHNATLGVDYFFTLSGFGMMYSFINKSESKEKYSILDCISYGWRHVKKIYSVYFITLVLGAIYYIIVGMFEYGKGFFESIAKSLTFLVIDASLLQSLTGIKKFSHSLNGVCWFLSTLFCIYIVSPMIGRRLKKSLNDGKKNVIGIVVNIVLSVLLAYVFRKIENRTIFDDLCYGSPYRRVFYVIMGMHLAQLYNISMMKKIVDKERIEYFIFLLAFVWYLTRGIVASRIGVGIYIIDMIIVASIVFYLAAGTGTISKFFCSKTMVNLGSISMYIFLVHYIIGLFTHQIMSLFFENTLIVAIIESCVILLLTHFVSILIYYLKKC
ncbi:acyltransferase family protein [Butyrivibrio sp. YAB3001]|uniref:acyltransferase family protein n=1 Tax=Butyrivibrio sp. YAB3001 TaxID=1520812 RepID=UPI0008F619B2|nr:acyltransferase [Butyrivibrio sp. YAB3001]SFC61911.1 Peptidoglycan/LPS O-acetylase OafA/YrhL, contains acyltransferase and SGNH-hydrolase domains [Butyrivibrio sp. YAB3001]